LTNTSRNKGIGIVTASDSQERSKGQLHIYDGEGKGKSQAALGVVLRTIGFGICEKRQSRVLLLRFLKGPERSYDEDSAIEALQRGFPHLIDHVRTGRSEFFTKELLILLKLIDENQIDYKSLYGSWAGAFGFFQFMPSTIKNHAIDFNTDNYIDLKNSHDAYASAANYLKKIGWKKDSPCFYRIDLKEDIPKKYLNVSAKKLQNKKKLGFFKKYIDNYDDISFLKSNHNVAIITPDKDIIPGADTLNPAYIVFDNYEIILQWNRSLRFALAVCTLKNKFKNAI